MIHSTAIVSSSAKLGRNVKIGPYAVIGDKVELADDVEIMSHVCVDGRTYVGSGTKIYPFAAIGFPPQDLKFHGEDSEVIIGQNNSIREYVTVHPGTEGGAMKTVIGNNNLLMIGVHIAHDCIIGNNTVLANNVTLGGHVQIGDDAIIGGMSAIHQFVRIGQHAIVGGMSGVERDVIPYGAVKGERSHLYDINMIGILRSGIDRNEIRLLKEAYKMIFYNEKTLAESVLEAEAHFSDSATVQEIVKFMKEKTNRSFCLPKDRS